MASELVDPSLFRFGLSISGELDKRFGKKTIAAKMTDVPGHTRGIVPLLAEAGVRVLHVGVNGGVVPPDVPPAFVWRHTDGSEVIVLYQKGGYGSITALADLPVALGFAHTGDNAGPHTWEPVVRLFAEWRYRFPRASVIASTMDDFARDLLANEPKLPVITDEIGDTWIYGAGCDPTLILRYRELSRLRNEWLEDGTARAIGGKFSKFSRLLLMVPEHTWGLDQKIHLADTVNFSAADFAGARNGQNYKKMEASWDEQQDYPHEALAALGDSEEAVHARQRLADTEPAIPIKDGYERADNQGLSFETAHFNVALDAADGAITRLPDKESGRNWAGEANALGRLTYELFSQNDYDRFLRQVQYQKERRWAFVNDFSRHGIEHASPTHRAWRPTLEETWILKDSAGTRLILELAGPREAVEDFGCPAKFMIEAQFPEREPTVGLTVQWFDKRACRLPEAIWLSFSPRVLRPDGWTMDKMGQRISPLEVIRNGNRKMHAVREGIQYEDEFGGLRIKSLDAPLVAPGAMSLLDFNNRRPPLSKGMHFNLYNNVWGTNFRMWFEGDARFRFTLGCSFVPRGVGRS